MSEPRKVYLATSGEYSDYRVEAVFTHRQHAEAFELGEDVEEYELYESPVEVRAWRMLGWQPKSGRKDNPYWYHEQRRIFDGRPRHVEHRWIEMGVPGRMPLLEVSGWDVEVILKVYREQRAQHEARQAGIA